MEIGGSRADVCRNVANFNVLKGVSDARSISEWSGGDSLIHGSGDLLFMHNY